LFIVESPLRLKFKTNSEIVSFLRSRNYLDFVGDKMAPIRFSIPLQRKDLLRVGSSGTFYVENEYSIRELKTKLVVSDQNGKDYPAGFFISKNFRIRKLWSSREAPNLSWKVDLM
jgi:hypothetical protein